MSDGKPTRKEVQQNIDDAREFSKQVYSNLCQSLAVSGDEPRADAVMCAITLFGAETLIDQLQKEGPPAVIRSVMDAVKSRAALHRAISGDGGGN